MPLVVILAVLGSAILHATWNALLKGSKDRDWTARWIAVSTLLVCAPMLPLVGIPSGVWGYLLGSAALHVVYLMLLGHAYKLKELSFAYPIARGSSPLLVATGGLLFAAEHAAPHVLVGIVAVVVGIGAIGLESQHWDAKGFALAVSIGVVVSIYTVMDGLAVRHTGASLQYNLWCFSLYGLGTLVVLVLRRELKWMRGSRKDLGLAIGGGVFSVAAYAVVSWAMIRSPLGSVSALRETSILFAAAIGALVLKERFPLQKVIGCVVIVAGAVLIGWR